MTPRSAWISYELSQGHVATFSRAEYATLACKMVESPEPFASGTMCQKPEHVLVRDRAGWNLAQAMTAVGVLGALHMDVITDIAWSCDGRTLAVSILLDSEASVELA